MKFYTSFIIYFVFCAIFIWISYKTDLYSKLFGRFRNKKYYKLILMLALIIFLFPLYLAQQSFNEKYGHPNYISTIIAAFKGSVCISFAMSYLREVARDIVNDDNR